MTAMFASKCEERESAKMFQASESCSVCLDAVNDSGERSIAKLKCGHHFHLDCIGSAFNAKGAMQCPNCRHVEDGQWLYANGSRWNEGFSIEEISYEDDYEVYQDQAMPSFVTGPDSFRHWEWCPYQHGSLQASGSSYPQFQVSLGDIDGPLGSIGFPEMVMSFYNESGGASSPPLVCPHLSGHPRQAQAAEDSRLRPPVSNNGPMRPTDPIGASNGASALGDVDVLHGSIWDPRGFGVATSNPGYTGDTPGSADGTRFSPEIDLSFLPRSGANLSSFYGSDTGSGPSTHERSRSWTRSETADRVASQGLGGLHRNAYGYHNGSSPLDSGSVPAGPCPRPLSTLRQGGTSQSQPQSSSVRSAPVGSIRRSSRHTGASAPWTSNGRTAASHASTLTSTEVSRRSNQVWNDFAHPLGQEPPVPGLESHGPSYHSGGQGFVPWRRENITGSSTSIWGGNSDMWQSGSRPSALLTSGLSHSEYIEGHGSALSGSSRPQRDVGIFRNALYEDYSPSFGREGSAEVGSSISHGIQLRPQR